MRGQRETKCAIDNCRSFGSILLHPVKGYSRTGCPNQIVCAPHEAPARIAMQQRIEKEVGPDKARNTGMLSITPFPYPIKFSAKTH